MRVSNIEYIFFSIIYALITLSFIINLYVLNLKSILGCVIVSTIPTLIMYCIYK
ncbi:MAG: hypothetical protein ACRCXA_01400 [Peptostreptococcaceae bacterium]